jgi:hypothetical protein
MSDPTIKRIVEVFTEPAETKEVSAELKQFGAHVRASLKHLNLDALSLLVWDLLPTRKRPARSTVREILHALSRIDEYTKEKP